MQVQSTSSNWGATWWSSRLRRQSLTFSRFNSSFASSHHDWWKPDFDFSGRTNWRSDWMGKIVNLSPFPPSIEKWWWRQAELNWPEVKKDKWLNLIRQEIVEQSDRFNKHRRFSSSSYGERDLSIISYGNFFSHELGWPWPTPLLKWYVFVIGMHQKKDLFAYWI